MDRRLYVCILILFGSLPYGRLFSQQVLYKTNPETGAIYSLNILGDDRLTNWIIATDGSQYPWVTNKYGWGLGYFTQCKNGKCLNLEWKTPSSIEEGENAVSYLAGDIKIDVKRKLEVNDLVEVYTFTNIGTQSVSLSDIGVYTPFNDNYPDSKTCVTARVHAHVWDGGSAAYINATHMGAKPPHLGLVLIEGSVKSYEIWERDITKGGSNARGIIALNIADAELSPGEKTSWSWRIFTHSGWDDFQNKIVEKGNIIVQSNQYTFQKGEIALLEIRGNEKLLKTCTVTKNGVSVPVRKLANKYQVETEMDKAGEVQFDISYRGRKQTHVNCIVFNDYKELLDKRTNFIIDRQQLNDSSDLRDGAYMVYDNETDQIFLNDTPSSSSVDRDEGAERLGMGVFLAKQYRLTKKLKIKESLQRYAKFVREYLQDDNYRTWSSVDQKGRNRPYNYAWMADFYFQMYKVTGDEQFAKDGYQTLKSMYAQFGHGFYAIGIPIRLSLEVLRETNMILEYESLREDFLKVGDIYVENGINYPKHEVNFEQGIVAPTVAFLSELYLITGIKKYLDEATRQIPILEAFSGFQPSFHMNGIAIRHWDGYWFGKYEMWGDSYPHYWSAITAAAYYYYSLCTNDVILRKRAESIVLNNLCLFSAEGQGFCTYVYPNRVNGEKAAFFDPYANDQDWALSFYLLVNADL